MVKRQTLPYILGGLAVIFAVTAAVLGYFLYNLSRAHEALIATHAATEETLKTTTTALDDANTHITKLSETLDETEHDLRQEKGKNEDFENQISKIAGTVSDLDKLSKTDEELLEKYSKVYFLNENYIPSDLSEIDNEWKYTEAKDLKLHSKVLPFFEDMLNDAKDDGVDLWVVSAYRSFETQAQLKGAYTMTYGSGANAFSADQGYSEHQLGTTIDFTTGGINGGLVTTFEDTPAYEWLQKHAYKYGFILSYPKENGYYVYEPWHWRFVGTDLADDLHDDGKNFYDLPQREIDQYLLHIFD
jgi:LAS superfamily LD-carboxypeptidase LdcB